jgi:polyisoprenoid-binding protein YceI
MKRNIAILLTVAFFMFTFQSVMSQTALKVKSNKMTVQGSSSLHDWESTITKADLKGEFVVDNHQLTEVKNLEVKIPVESIKSTKGKMMDNKTYDAFRYEKNPYIIYSLNNAKINSATNTIDATGTLTMAGVSRPMEVQGKYKILENGEVQLVLSRKFKMTEFKMDPPTAMMGSIKVGDEVTVNFDFVVNAKLIQ